MLFLKPEVTHRPQHLLGIPEITRTHRDAQLLSATRSHQVPCSIPYLLQFGSSSNTVSELKLREPNIHKVLREI
jgi:hypothetical protein